MSDWNYPHFTREEMACRCGKCGGENKMQPSFMAWLENLRAAYGRPMRVTSAYRCAMHPEEVNKPFPGAHNQGVAVDIAVSGADALGLISAACGAGLRGLGVSQKGDKRFIHLDMSDGPLRPGIWSY